MKIQEFNQRSTNSSINHINVMIPCLFYTNWGFTHITPTKSRVWVISSKTLNKGGTILQAKTLGIQNTYDLKMKHTLVWSSSPSPSSSSSSSSFLPSSPILRFALAKNETYEFCLSLLSFYTPIILHIAIKPLIFQRLHHTFVIYMMAHFYSFYDFHILYGNYNFILVLVP